MAKRKWGICCNVCLKEAETIDQGDNINDFIHCSELSLAQGLVVDHAPPTIMASYDKALLWTTKNTVFIEICQLTAPKQEFETYLGFTVATDR